MPSLEKQLKDIKKEEKRILQEIDKKRSRKKIKCASCDKTHQINTLKAIQTHWHTSSYGCTGGDYWNEGELQFICPTTGIRNRLLFDNYDVPYEEREEYKNDPEAQFKSRYKHLFKEVEDEYDEREFGGPKYEFVNNYDVDQRRESFGLVKRRKKKD